MKRSAVLVAVVTSLWLAAGAVNAATVTVSADAPVVGVGDTITLTVNTDSEGEAIVSAFVQVSYDPILVLPGLATQSLPPGFVGGSLVVTDLPGWKTVLDTIGIAPADTGTSISATVTFTALAPGVATFTLGSGHGLVAPFDFGSASPGNFVSVTIVPEPATATLLGVGLIAFAAARRGRR